MKLLEPIKLGNKTLKNRVAMAPMTRARASRDGIVQEMTVTYYDQRATAGLLISEAINISEQAIGSPFTPEIYNEDQINAWKKVTEKVHANGGVIFAQLWHTGRVGHSVDRNGVLPVSASAVPISGAQHFTSQGMKPYETPTELSIPEIKNIVKDYQKAAENAIAAGFDGVELHAASGYLPNQFLVDGVNQRTDEYGGSIENRCRFTLEIMEALIETVGNDKLGIKLSPVMYFNEVFESNPVELFTYLIKKLNDLSPVYLQLMRSSPLTPLDDFPQYPKDVIKTFGLLFDNTLIANSGYTRDSAEADVESDDAQMISFGMPFIANPDLVKRFELNAELSQPDQATMYGGAEKGYIDYPFLTE